MLIEISPSLSPPKPIIKLWTPNTLSTLSLFLGFPAGITLATINWIKMGMTRKAIPHILIGIAGLVALFFLPDNLSRMVGLALSIGYIAFLRQQMTSDIERLDGFEVQNSHWLSGVAISLGEWGIFIAVFFAIEWFPSLGQVSSYNIEGTNYFNQGDYKNAIASFDKAIELDPNDVISYTNRGLSYIYLEDYDRGIADCNKAIELDPNYANAYLSRGMAYGFKGNYDHAMNDFTQAIELDPNEPLSFYNRAITFDILGNHEYALADYDKAIELNPNYIEAYVNRGLLHASLGHTSEAIKDFEKILEISNDPDLRQKVEKALKELKGQ